MVPWSAPGDVLRWWRSDVLGLSQQEAAEKLSVQPSALSNWEHGARAISIDIAQLDETFGAGGALAGLLWGIGTVKGLDPAQMWTHVFPGASTPVWVWLRSQSSPISLIGEWGVARMEPELELGENGVFITVGASVSESPVVFRFSQPGWADFGRGELPASVPGATVIPGVELLRRSSASGAFMDLFIGNIARKFDSPRSRDLAMLAKLGPKAVTSFLTAFTRTSHIDPPRPWPPVPDGIDELDRLRFPRLRRARGRSLADVVRQLRLTTGITISKETLRRFETDVGRPHDRFLPVALDHVLGGGGNLGLTTVRYGRGRGAVTFPPYWRGPVWLEFTGPQRTEMIRLHWGDWYRQIRLVLPALLTFTCSTPEAAVRINADSSVEWTAGIGRRPGAVPIDQDWVPASMRVAQRALSEAERAMMRALRLHRPGTSGGP